MNIDLSSAPKEAHETINRVVTNRPVDSKDLELHQESLKEVMFDLEEWSQESYKELNSHEEMITQLHAQLGDARDKESAEDIQKEIDDREERILTLDHNVSVLDKMVARILNAITVAV